MDELEKLDQIRDRLGVTYGQAKEILDANEGDVLKALIAGDKDGWDLSELEEKAGNCWENIKGQEWTQNLKEQFKKGRGSKIKIKRGQQTLLTVPAPLGILGVAGMLASGQLAFLGALSSLTAMAHNCSLEFEAGQSKSDQDSN